MRRTRSGHCESGGSSACTPGVVLTVIHHLRRSKLPSTWARAPARRANHLELCVAECFRGAAGGGAHLVVKGTEERSFLVNDGPAGGQNAMCAGGEPRSGEA